MSTLNHLFDSSEQICYVQCGYCNTILLVSVPCSSLTMVVTVKCGHCTGLLSVNMKKASFLPFHLLPSLNQDERKDEACEENVEVQNNDTDMRSSAVSSNNEDGDLISVNHTVNKPPEKRQRAPSAYNRFIREEIKRLKAENPNMAHKEAFSTAAKNWAHFPPIHYKEDGDESCSQRDDDVTLNSDVVEINHNHKSICRATKRVKFSVREKPQEIPFGQRLPSGDCKLWSKIAITRDLFHFQGQGFNC